MIRREERGAGDQWSTRGAAPPQKEEEGGREAVDGSRATLHPRLRGGVNGEAESPGGGQPSQPVSSCHLWHAAVPGLYL